MSEEQPNVGENAPKFNMALDTLRRLSNILERITQLDMNTELIQEIKQPIKISLVKSFFVGASPLMSDENTKAFGDKILPLEPKVMALLNRQGMASGGFRNIFDVQLNIQLDNFLIELQTILQKDGYFMPPSEESGLF